MTQRSERQKMLAGEPYLESDPELVAMTRRARRLVRDYNQADYQDDGRRASILRELLGRAGRNLVIEPPFLCDYGAHIFTGDGVYINFNCIILDGNRVDIEDNVMLGPSVQIYTATHPVEASLRIAGPESAHPIRIGRNVWIGGGAILCSGVTIGADTTIGAGSVVVRDIPGSVLAAGNPCRIVRKL